MTGTSIPTLVVIVTCLVCFQDVISTYGADQDFNFENVTVVIGSTASLNCSISPDHPDGIETVQWIRTNGDGSVITMGTDVRVSDPRISVSAQGPGDANLVIESVQPADHGQYTCRIRGETRARAALQNYFLNVLVPAQIQNITRKRLTGYEGDTFMLMCNATGNPAPVISWFFSPLGDGERTRTRRLDTTGSKLVLRGVLRTQAGDYFCQADNGVGNSTERHMTVDVQFRPEVSVFSTSIGQSPGRDTILGCTIEAHPFGVSTWFKDGEAIPVHRSLKYSTELYRTGRDSIDLSLRIRSLSTDDYGTYTCYAANNWGESQKDILLYDYSEKYPPTTTPTPRPTTTTTPRPTRVTMGRPSLEPSFINVTVQEGNTAVLPCSVDIKGFKVVWIDQWSTLLTLDDRRIKDDPRITIDRPYPRDWNLILRKVSYRDRGRYTCQINTNPVISNTVMLVVLENFRTYQPDLKSSPTTGSPTMGRTRWPTSGWTSGWTTVEQATESLASGAVSLHVRSGSAYARIRLAFAFVTAAVMCAVQ